MGNPVLSGLAALGKSVAKGVAVNLLPQAALYGASYGLDKTMEDSATKDNIRTALNTAADLYTLQRLGKVGDTAKAATDVGKVALGYGTMAGIGAANALNGTTPKKENYTPYISIDNNNHGDLLADGENVSNNLSKRKLQYALVPDNELVKGIFPFLNRHDATGKKIKDSSLSNYEKLSLQMYNYTSGKGLSSQYGMVSTKDFDDNTKKAIDYTLKNMTKQDVAKFLKDSRKVQAFDEDFINIVTDWNDKRK